MKTKTRRYIREILLVTLLSLGALITIVPFLFMVSTALKGKIYAFEFPPHLIPENPILDNFTTAWIKNDFDVYFLNSIFVSVVSVLCILLLASMMAFAFARYQFIGKKILYGIVIFFMTLPPLILIVPQFIVARDLRLTDNLAGLISWNIAINLPFAVFLLRGFLEEVPKEIEEAAHIDGASPWATYWKVILPLCKPALATSASLAFLSAWDEYIWANTIINTPERRTLPVAIANYQGAYITNWGNVFAASLIAVVPVLILFILLQKYYIKGMVAGAVKG